MPREKVTVEERIEAAKSCIEGENSQAEVARRLGVAKSTVISWVKRYIYRGSLAFKKQVKNNVYSPTLKYQAVEEYQREGSLREVAGKYGLRSTRQLSDWIKVYNSGRDFKNKMSGGSRMKQGRETTQEERIAIVKDCLEHGSNYGESAVKHDVSYQQVYTWVRKFSELGKAGLEDRRGKRMATQEPRSELEGLKVKLARLEHENYILRIERDLLKKVEELERRDAFRK